MEITFEYLPLEIASTKNINNYLPFLFPPPLSLGHSISEFYHRFSKQHKRRKVTALPKHSFNPISAPRAIVSNQLVNNTSFHSDGLLFAVLVLRLSKLLMHAPHRVLTTRIANHNCRGATRPHVSSRYTQSQRHGRDPNHPRMNHTNNHDRVGSLKSSSTQHKHDVKFLLHRQGKIDAFITFFQKNV